jgi:hypothetical protein
MMTNDRWRIACHEAGHAVACLALGGQCIGVMLHVDGGLAMNSELFGDLEAYSIACGPGAESLSEQFDSPEREPVSLDVVASNPPVDTEFSLWCMVADVPGIHRRFQTDDQRLAQWAICNREDDPDCWARRVRFACFIAGKIIETNQAAILRVATELYERGAVTGDKIKQLCEE